MAAKAHKPVLAAWMGGRVVAEGMQVLNEAGIPTYTTPEKAVRAFMHLVSYARNLRDPARNAARHPAGVHASIGSGCAACSTRSSPRASEILSENVSKAFLEAYEIPVTKPQAARTADEAVEVAHRRRLSRW